MTMSIVERINLWYQNEVDGKGNERQDDEDTKLCCEFSSFRESLHKQIFLEMDDGKCGRIEELSGPCSSDACSVLEAFRRHMDDNGDRKLRMNTAMVSSLYCSLLAVGGAGVYSYVDTSSLLVALGVVKKLFSEYSGTIANSGDGKRKKIDAESILFGEENLTGKNDEDKNDDMLCEGYEMGLHCVDCLNIFFARALVDDKEMLKSISLILAETAPLEFLCRSKQSSNLTFGNDKSSIDIESRKKKRKADKSVAANKALASLSAMETLIGNHGSVIDSAVVVLRSIAMCAFLNLRVGSSLATPFRNECLKFVTKLFDLHGTLVEPAIAALMRHLCLCSPERMEERSQILVCVGNMFKLLCESEKMSFSRFVYRLSRTKKPKHRLVAVDVASLLLRQLKQVSETLKENCLMETDDDLLHNDIEIDGAISECCILGMGLLLQRSSDKSNQIRGRALNNLADAISISSNIPSLKPILNKLSVAKLAGKCPSTTPRVKFNIPTDEAYVPLEELETHCEAGHSLQKNTIGPGASPLDAVAPSEDLIEILCRRCKDESAVVRKAATLALERFLIAGRIDEETKIGVGVIARGCFDGFLTVRRQSLNSLGALLDELPSNKIAVTNWINYALPLSFDTETTIVDRVAVWVKELVLDPLCDPNSKHEHRKCAFELIHHINTVPSVHLAFESSIIRGAQQKLLDGKHILKGVQSLLENAEDTLALSLWLLCSILGSVFPRELNCKQLQRHWKEMEVLTTAADTDENINHILRCIACAANNFKPNEAVEVMIALKRNLASLQLNPYYVSSHVKALFNLINAIEPIERQLAARKRSFLSIFEAAMQFIKGLVSDIRINGNIADSKKTATVLYTVGEMALVSSSTELPDSLVTMVQALLTEGSFGDEDNVIPPVVQAHAWVALGKLCFIDGKLAKKCMPLFVQQLGISGMAAVRNNIVIVLTDLCTKYTSLVDGHIAKISSALGDECEIVRRQTLILLSGLLHNDYVKWRGPLLHRILLALVDKSSAVREIAEGTFGSNVKATNLAYNHFMESILVLNGRRCEITGTMTSVTMISNEAVDTLQTTTCTLLGDDNRLKRLSIYSSLLQHMTLEQRLATSARVCTDLLSKFCDNKEIKKQSPSYKNSCAMQLEDDADLLFDSLAILQLPEMKPMTPTGKTGDDAPFELDSAPASAVAATKRKVLSEITRRSLSEIIVPTLVELKSFLKSRHSAFVADVMAALCAQCSNQTKDLPEMLATDPQLLKELLFDIREYERHNAKFAKTPIAPKLQSLNYHITPKVEKTKVDAEAIDKEQGHINAQSPANNATIGVELVNTPASAGRSVKQINLHGVCPQATPVAALVLSSPLTVNQKRADIISSKTPSTGMLTVPRLRNLITPMSRQSLPPYDEASHPYFDTKNDDEFAIEPIPINGIHPLSGILANA